METKLEEKVPEQDSKIKEIKKESQEEQSKEDSNMKDVEILEFGLSEEEINELIEKLNQLKKTKTEVSFEIDDENEFLIKYIGTESVDVKTDLSDTSMRG